MGAPGYCYDHAGLAFWLDRLEREYSAQQARGVHAPLAGKLLIGIERSLFSAFLNEPLGLYYLPRPDPIRQICIQVRMQLFHAQHFPACTGPIGRFVFPDFGLALLPSLFGAFPIYRDGLEPAWANKVLVPDGHEPPRDLPDFERSGLMPNVLDCYASMRKLLPPEWSIGFPGWPRGPLGTIAYWRGEENIYTDLMTNPDLARRMMEYGIRARFAWLGQRARLLGQVSPGPDVLFNDDVSGENFSPETYRTQVLPYERQCYEFHGGHLGYHSCGNLTPFLRDIRTLGPLDFLHVSAWTELEKVVEVFHPDTHLYVALHPLRDVLGASAATTRDRLTTIKKVCSGGPFSVLMTELMSYRSPAQDLAAIKRAVEIAGDVLG